MTDEKKELGIVLVGCVAHTLCGGGTRDKFRNIGDWGPQGVEWDLIDIGKCNQIA